ncbi:hypothetical protein RKD49_000250 [Streptomyces glaucescens]
MPYAPFTRTRSHCADASRGRRHVPSACGASQAGGAQWTYALRTEHRLDAVAEVVHPLTGLIGALAVAARVVIAVFHGGLTTPNHLSQIIGLAVLSILAVIVCLTRDRRTAELVQVRTVSEAAPRALLRPLPRRLGPLHSPAVHRRSGGGP